MYEWVNCLARHNRNNGCLYVLQELWGIVQEDTLTMSLLQEHIFKGIQEKEW